ncbi:putative polysaccharide biosynthesis protein [Metabacillus iocasae]|uniref:O-antigen/teichoic acid export membrane protein n=1 Tax=Priestia iocasae TaxID=2291674 RepID=A0ABS2QZM2_9BACI|nr:polysaccharide biosynthesis protein [Metabacillus iocasae]MBM7703909.1 O-antigen/teichoic acid export membrane protein [Metabacillus iocasae]
MKNQFIRGTFLLTAASLISKILGFVYIMPFTMLVGTSGYALYKYAYSPYTLMLSVSTLGLPLAVSKFVSKYNGMGNYRAGYDLLRSGMILMITTGAISCITLYVLAPTLAQTVVQRDDGSGNALEDVIYVIRLVSMALLVVPPMSLLRGYFQGNQSMGPSALSTVLEQFVRVVFIVGGAYTVIKVWNGTNTDAVGIGTLGAFVGGVAGFCTLLIIYQRRKRFIHHQIYANRHVQKLSLLSIYKELIGYAIPFVVVGLTLPIYQNIDTFTINRLFQAIGYALEDAEEINSIIGFTQILIMIPVSLATAFGMSLIPTITAKYVANELKAVYDILTKTMQILCFFLIPAVVGLTLLSHPIYLMLFGIDNNPFLGGELLKFSAGHALTFGLFTVTAAILQGLNQQKQLIFGMFVGVGVKFLLNLLLVPAVKEVGPILATYAGYMVSILFNVYFIKKTISYSFTQLYRPLFWIGSLSAGMGLVVFMMSEVVRAYFSHHFASYHLSWFIVISSVGAGLFFYLGLGIHLSFIKEMRERRS